MLQIKFGLGLAAMALVCIVAATSERVIIAGKKALTSANGYCKAHFHRSTDGVKRRR